MDKLKECPFCGCNDTSINVDAEDEFVWCPLCLCRIEFVEGDIVDNYNKRHLSSKSSGRDEALSKGTRQRFSSMPGNS